MKALKRNCMVWAAALLLVSASLTPPVLADDAGGRKRVGRSNGEIIESELFISQDTDIVITGTVGAKAPITILGGNVTISGGGTLLRVADDDGNAEVLVSSGNMLNIYGGEVTLMDITLDGGGAEFTIEADGAVKRGDKTPDGEKPIEVDGADHLGINMTGGTLILGAEGKYPTLRNHSVYDDNIPTGRVENGFGSAIRQTGGTIVMNGGTIRNCHARNFGNIYIGTGATFEMKDGTITGGSVSQLKTIHRGGGAFYVNGTLKMSGGTISGNSAVCAANKGVDKGEDYGGGIYCAKDGSATLEEPAKITGNFAGHGADIYVESLAADNKLTCDDSIQRDSRIEWANTSLYQWTKWKVIWDANGGSFPGSDSPIETWYERYTALGDMPKPTRTETQNGATVSYTLEGWYTTPDASKGERALVSTIVRNEETRYYANWVKNENELAPSAGSVVSKGAGNTVESGNVTIELATANDEDYIYTGQEKTLGIISVKYGDTLLGNDDYDVSYADNIDAGAASVIITGKGDYTGTIQIHSAFRIGPADIGVATIEVTPESYIYDGGEKKPAISVKLENGQLLVAGKDYQAEVKYSDNVDAGTATVEITGMGNYTGTTTGGFRIAAAGLTESGATVAAIADQVYTGEEIVPEFLVTASGDVRLVKGKDYTVSCADNIDVGTATVTVTGTGNYSGTLEAAFDIVKAASSVTRRPKEKEGLVYTGAAQELVTGGEAAGGEMWYSLDNQTWSDEIPTATEAGVYTIYYKVVGDGNHSDSEVGTVTATIPEPEASYIVTWTDGVGEPREESAQSGAKLEKPADPVKEGKLFAGWYREEALTNEWDFDADTVEGNVTLYAKWLDILAGELTIGGEAKYGETLTATVTDPNVDAASLRYTWKRGDEVVAWRTESGQYPLTADDIDQTITCEVMSVSAGTSGVLRASIDGVVGKAVVTVGGITAENKVYDGTTAAALGFGGVTFTGKIDGDDLTVTATGAFEDADVGENKTVKISDLTLGEESARKYALAPSGNQESAATSITRADFAKVTIANIDNQIYTGNGLEPELVITYTPDGTDNALRLVEGTDYTAVYADNVDVGTATVTVTGTGNYSGTLEAAFDIVKAASSVVRRPEEKEGLVYTGAAQELVTVGEAAGGEMQYSLDNQTWSDEIPTAAEAGVYTIYYKVVGDDNHNDSEAGSVTATIPEASYTVTWADGVDEPREESARFGAKLEKPDDPVKEGKIFAGWYREEALTNEWDFGADTVEGNVTLYAKWLDILAGELTIGGETKYGKTLTATVTDPDVDAASLRYTWKRGEEVVAWRTESGQYPLTADDIGQTITCEVMSVSAGTSGVLRASIDGVVGKAVVTVGGITAENKVYDGTTAAALGFGGVTFTGKIDGDDLTVTATGTFEDADVGENKTVKISGLTLGEESARKYALAPSGNQESAAASITAADFAKVTIANIDNQIYTGNGLEPELVITYTPDGTDNALRLVKGTDYTAVYADNVDVGTAAVTVTGTGNYSGTLEATFRIAGTSLGGAKITLSETSYEYDGTPKTPEVVSVELGGRRLTRDDYTVSYLNNTDAGTATVRITGAGNYAGTVDAAFAIGKGGFGGAKITLEADEYLYDGNAKEPAVTVTVGDKTLTRDTDYTVAYSDNTNAGAATVAITGKGNYEGETASRAFTILSNDLGDAAVALSRGTYPYSGAAQEPPVTVTLNGKTLTRGTDYTVSYRDNTDTGTATVTVTGTGAYRGSARASFEITPSQAPSQAVYYTVTYRNGGGSGAEFSENVASGATISLPGETAFGAPSGKQFRAWRIGGRDYAPYRDYTVYSDVTVTAQWEDAAAVTAAPANTAPADTAATAARQDGSSTRIEDCERDALCPIAAFSDTQTSAWYHDGLHWALEKGVVSGVIRRGVRQLEPYGTTTRAQLVTMLWRLDGSPRTDPGQPFGDVEQGAYYASAARWAGARNIAGGSGAGRFGPDEELTREEVVTILYNYARYKGLDTGGVADLGGYADGYAVSASASAAVRWALRQGVIYGRQGSWLDPRDSTNRAEAVTMLYRVFGE